MRVRLLCVVYYVLRTYWWDVPTVRTYVVLMGRLRYDGLRCCALTMYSYCRRAVFYLRLYAHHHRQLRPDAPDRQSTSHYELRVFYQSHNRSACNERLLDASIFEFNTVLPPKYRMIQYNMQSGSFSFIFTHPPEDIKTGEN